MTKRPKLAKVVSDILAPPPRFLRAVQLERDFLDPNALSHFVTTLPQREALLRITSALAVDSPRRAWRVTGDYGVGKSTFALALARLLAPDARALPKSLRECKAVGRSTLLPVLAVGRRESLSATLARAIDNAEASVSGKSVRRRLSEKPVTGDALLERIADLNALVRKRKTADGLLLVIDELGRPLELAADTGAAEDLILVQDLADAAARSNESPIIVVGLLHQGFESYAASLPEASRREWAKVGGRYDEIVLTNDLGTTLQLVADALGTRSSAVPPTTARKLAQSARTLSSEGWFGGKAAADSVAKMTTELYPLHPAVIPVMAALFRRVGQNERSLYSWIHGDEPGSVARWAKTAPVGSVYDLGEAFTYVRANMASSLITSGLRVQWNQALQTVDRAPAGSLSALRTLALLGLVETDGFVATKVALEACITELGGEVFDRLKAQGLVYERGTRGFRIWSQQQVSLRDALASAEQALSAVDVLSVVSGVLDFSPIVARRHGIETGTLRHYDVRVIRADHLAKFHDSSSPRCDGLVVIAVPAAPRDVKRAMLDGEALSKARPDVLVGVAKPLHGLADEAKSLEQWRWVKANTPELANDETSAWEVGREIRFAERRLRSRAESALGLEDSSELAWFADGYRFNVDASRGLSAAVSTRCDKRFSQAPILKNELVNRRAISSAAAAARQRLIEAIFDKVSEPMLGLPEAAMPPEKSVYLSVLHASGLHAEREGGHWGLAIPSPETDPCRVRPMFDAMFHALENRPDRRDKVAALIDHLRAEPLGVRDGVLPLAFAVFIAAHPGEVALYEDQTFVPGVDGNLFQRMLKDPGAFEIQWLPADEEYRKLYLELNALLRSTGHQTDLVGSAKALLSFARRLPAYTRTTSDLSTESRRVREALFGARDPAKLILRDLPVAVGVSPFDTGTPPTGAAISSYIGGLRSAINALSGAYDALMVSVGARLGEALHVTSGDPRAEAAAVGVHLRQQVSDVRLRGFCGRLADTSLNDQAWLESVASFVAERPPKDWRDDDTRHFFEELAILSTRLDRVRLIGSNPASNGAVHVYLTRGTGDEVARIVPAAGKTDEAEVTVLVKKLRAVLGPATPLTLLAATEYLRSELVELGNEQAAKPAKRRAAT